MRKHLVIVALIIQMMMGQLIFAQTSSGVLYSHPSGNYNSYISLALKANRGDTIYYTLDGQMPTKKSYLYKNEPIHIAKTSVVRSIAVNKNVKSIVNTHTYFIKESSNQFITVSIAVPPAVLFNEDRGLFVGDNFNNYKEVLINTQIFEKDGKEVFNSPTGMRLFGGYSRIFPQKSLALITRDAYGANRIEYKLFGKTGLRKFQYLVLRNGGSDWGKAHFRDPLMQELVKDWDMESQDFRPAKVFINGQYWGVYNLTEKINRQYLADHTGVDKDSLDLIEHYKTLKYGDDKDYFSLLDYMRSNDLSKTEHYNYLSSKIDIDNFIQYQVAQIYCDNRDAGGNVRFWKPKNGKWRWILYDTDYGFGLFEENAYRFNTLEFRTTDKGEVWPNPAWSTFMLRKLLVNPTFKQKFITSFCDRLNADFSSQNVLSTIERLHSLFKNEMSQHHERWNLSQAEWEKQVEIMRVFAQKRPSYVLSHLKSKFKLKEIAQLAIASFDGGMVTLNNNIAIDSVGMNANYFSDFPVQLKATPKVGFRFSHWEVNNGEKLAKNDIWVTLKGKNNTIKPVFTKYDEPLVEKIVINEFSVNNNKLGDWIELYNNSGAPVNLDKWVLSDAKNDFILPNVTLMPKGYIVFAQYPEKLRQVFPDKNGIFGNLNFGLKRNRENISLLTNNGDVIDHIEYVVEKESEAFTMSLGMPTLNNNDSSSWDIIRGNGTPNAPNPYVLSSQRERWMRYGSAMGLFMIGFSMLFMNRRKRLF